MVKLKLTQGLHAAYKRGIMVPVGYRRGNVVTMPQAAGETAQKTFNPNNALREIREAAADIGNIVDAFAARQPERVRLYTSIMADAPKGLHTPKPSMADLVKRAHQELGR